MSIGSNFVSGGITYMSRYIVFEYSICIYHLHFHVCMILFFIHCSKINFVTTRPMQSSLL